MEKGKFLPKKMEKSTKNTSARKLKSYSHYIRYIADKGGIRKIMANIFPN